MLLTRVPRPSLRPFVRSMWAADPGPVGAAAGEASLREHVLPTGDMHLVFRLSGPPLRLFVDAVDSVGYTVGYAIVGGARSAFYARDVSVATGSVGVQFRPGVARALFGMPADELAERHTPLDALWGAQASEALERVHEAGTPAARLTVLEDLLNERLEPQPRAMHPAVAQALLRLGGGAMVSDLVDASGYSHRRFIALFRDAAGLPPKRLERVLRFQRVMAAEPARGTLPWADLALQSGYSDQPHFNRDFLEITGMTPQAYRRASPSSPNHVRA
ncbi:AraC family transcriptional regulator [Variovorax sp. J22R115]|uniref:helix-turn-helix domain-containing protein n=1 Tax=Variovorax sp. J22R115 TaxID=3053509 RepID=UPI002578A189|nr:helix-turn-helix domain-containing protein [Variovorax sp. J22R115]MDM0048040.1 helix-turn-helix domain-containing protein [Variovorax sp. J22R115]